jgi:hypothetical protein
MKPFLGGKTPFKDCIYAWLSRGKCTCCNVLRIVWTFPWFSYLHIIDIFEDDYNDDSGTEQPSQEVGRQLAELGSVPFSIPLFWPCLFPFMSLSLLLRHKKPDTSNINIKHRRRKDMSWDMWKIQMAKMLRFVLVLQPLQCQHHGTHCAASVSRLTRYTTASQG